jgi:hypothetical protein
MITLRLAIPAVLAAAAVAGCVTYFVIPAPPKQVEHDRPLPPTVPSVKSSSDPELARNIQRPPTKERIDAFERAADAILRNAKASTADAPAITGPVPLPKPRPPLAP